MAQEKMKAKTEVRNKIRELLDLDNNASEVDILEALINLKAREQPKPLPNRLPTSPPILVDPYGALYEPNKITWTSNNTGLKVREPNNDFPV